MKIERPNGKALTPEETSHLEILKQKIRQALSDGKASRQEMEDVWRMINADGKVTPEELQVLRSTIHEVTGATSLEREWW